MYWQEILTTTIVCAAILVTARNLYDFFRKPVSKCSGCSGCSLKDLKKT